VCRGSLESLDLLLAHGGELANAGLMHAATASGRVSAMTRVLELGADINEGDDMLKTGFPTYGTPLLRAIKKGKAEAVRFLLERGASVTKPGHDGWTPLQIVRMECCGGRSLCIVHGKEIVPEIKELIETAVEREGSGTVSENREETELSQEGSN
jgi:Ankyrin repeats (3 copies)